MDIVMPVMDGPSAAGVLRNDDRTKEIPIVFLTSLVEKNETRRNNHEIGDNCFVSKSLLAEELLPLLKRTLRA